MRQRIAVVCNAALAALAALAVTAHAGDRLSQRELNGGYAQLYDAAGSLDLSGKILLIKFESDATEAIVKDLSESMERIHARLGALDREDPELELTETGLPEIEKRKRAAVMKDRLHRLRPLGGKTGRDFERSLLQSYSGSLHQLEFLALELDKADPDPERSAFLRETHATVTRLYARVVGEIDRKHCK